MNKEFVYKKFLERLNEMKEYEWNCYDIKIFEESSLSNNHGVRCNETAVEAIARNMVEVLEQLKQY